MIPYIIMKRHLIEDDASSAGNGEGTQCPKTNLVFLGDCQTLVTEDRDNLEDKRRDSKRRKLQDHRSEIHYLNLVSSAAKLLDQREAQDKKEDKVTQEEVPASDQTCSAVSTLSSTSGRSRSDSTSSEFSVYRSYEMELMNQPLNECPIPRAPRLPTAMEIPFSGEIAYKLHTRHYGECPELKQGSKNENQIQIQTIIYR